MKKITIVGAGYVGMSMAVLLSQKSSVVAYDLDESKVKLINNKKSPIQDSEISYFLSNKNLNLIATNKKARAYEDSDFVVVATPTNFCDQKNFFDTSSVEMVIEECLSINKNALIVIKSTVPIGFTEKVRKKFNTNNIIFSPEFLREGNCLADNLYPSRIVVGDRSEKAEEFASLLTDAAASDCHDIPLFLTSSSDAEAIKLFSNTFLAMRVAFFNEVDTFCESRGLDTKIIIEGMGNDTRIGMHYNNPSFGYGGYCLPKDSKQLLSHFDNVPNNIIKSIVKSNYTRKNFITSQILIKKPKIVGVYKIAMKKGSDNFRESAVIDIMNALHGKGVNILLYDPNISNDEFKNNEIFKTFNFTDDLKKFKSLSDIILCNRASDELQDVNSKIYTRDVFGVN